MFLSLTKKIFDLHFTPQKPKNHANKKKSKKQSKSEQKENKNDIYKPNEKMNRMNRDETSEKNVHQYYFCRLDEKSFSFSECLIQALLLMVDIGFHLLVSHFVPTYNGPNINFFLYFDLFCSHSLSLTHFFIFSVLVLALFADF